MGGGSSKPGLFTGYKTSSLETETSFPDTETSSLDTETIAHWKRKPATDVEAGFSDMKTNFPDKEINSQDMDSDKTKAQMFRYRS
jgi:hypothetical protein